MKGFLALLAVVFVVAFAWPHVIPRPPESAAVGSPKGASAEEWRRMKDCAAQSERLAKRYEWDKAGTAQEPHVTGWENHYSARHGRCFISGSWYSPPASKDALAFYEELYDAFEGRILATCNGAVVKAAPAFCSINERGGSSGDCGACRSFIDERMAD